MDPSSYILERTRHVSYLRVDSKQVDRELMVVESYLKKLGDLQITAVKSLDSPEVFPCDLLSVIIGISIL